MPALKFVKHGLKIYVLPYVSNHVIKRHSCWYIETKEIIARANHLTGFYMIATLTFSELRIVFMWSSYGEIR